MKTGTAAKQVFVVEDSLPMRARLVEMLGEINGVQVVGEAGTPAAAVTGILHTLPDVVVLDFQLEGGTAVDVLRAVRALAPGMIFIVLTNHPQAQFCRVCMEAGANAFFDKSSEINKVRDLIMGLLPTVAE